jgi:bifunctional non-homologous end joining protein LigD
LIRCSDHVIASGAKFHQPHARSSSRGIVSKRRAAPYHGGRQTDWIKVKCTHREEFAVLGWTDPSGSCIGIGSLILGYYDQAGTLYLAGKVGTGFSDRVLANLRRRVEHRAASGFPRPPGGQVRQRGEAGADGDQSQLRSTKVPAGLRSGFRHPGRSRRG